MNDRYGSGRSVGVRALAALAFVGCIGAGCTRVRDHKGYVVDSTLIDTVQPGIDNRDSVTKTLGRPSFASEWDGGGTWYYLARDTRQYAFSNPYPVSQLLLTVRFAGNVVSAVQKTGLETIRNVPIYGKRTPTLGRERGFFTELFGNIGTIGGANGTGPTSDNPTG